MLSRTRLPSLVPLDANHNPEGAFLNERRLPLGAGYERPTAGALWSTLDGRNLTDQRPPVAESELGDAQYYRLPTRQLRLSASVRF